MYTTQTGRQILNGHVKIENLLCLFNKSENNNSYMFFFYYIIREIKKSWDLGTVVADSVENVKRKQQITKGDRYPYLSHKT